MKSDLAHRREVERRKYLQLQARGYGRTNHGRHAVKTVLRWRPRLVVDFGCGNNAFIASLRRCGIDGLGIDFANDAADICAPMHDVPLPDGVADVVTSFDALEHLLPEDVDTTFDEMSRIAASECRFILSICTRPSKFTVNGENLHPTVRPLQWWIGRVERVGLVTSHRACGGRYITGYFGGERGG